MTTMTAAPLSPKNWCEKILARLPEQAGVVQDGDTLAALLTDLAADDPTPDAFAVILGSLERDARPEIAAAARRIRATWERDLQERTGEWAQPKPRALVVDDEASIGEMVAMVLEPRFDVAVATSGAEAVALARAEPPALVVLDVIMPEMDGYE